jgi:hypothetical protein
MGSPPPDSATGTVSSQQASPERDLRDEDWESARALELGWTEAPFASLIAVPGTACRCTVSRQGLSALAAIDDLGPDEAYQVFEQLREDIESIARWKVRLLGPPRDHVVAVCAEDVRDHALLG